MKIINTGFNFVAIGLFSLFAFDVVATTITFDDMPTAVFETPTPAGFVPAVGYDELNFHFAPLHIPGTGFFNGQLFPPHIHSEVDALKYHADAGGWYSNQVGGDSFNLIEVDLIEVSSITERIAPNQLDILPGDLIFETVGGANDGHLERIAPGTTGIFSFGSEFQGIDSYLVYFEGYKANFPPNDVSFSSTIDNIVVSAVPLPAAVWMFGSGLIGALAFVRKHPVMLSQQYA